MASPGGKGIAGAERIQQPSPTLPRDNQPQKELRTSPAAGEDFSGFISPEELEVHPDPSASDLVHPPPNCSAGNRGAGCPESMQGHGYPAVWALIVTSL